MKKLNILVISFLLSAIALVAQNNKSFEGTIIYSISVDGNNFPKEIQMMFNGAESHTYIKGNKRRMDINMSMQNTSTIINAETKTAVTLMDLMGQKYLIRSAQEDIKKEEAAMPEIKYNYTNETKTIAGYKCKKVEVSMKVNGKDETYSIYVTEEIPYTDYKNTYKGLKGFPLEYVINQSGMEMTFSAKSVTVGNVSDSKFDIPSTGYTEFTFDEFQKEMMKYGSF